MTTHQRFHIGPLGVMSFLAATTGFHANAAAVPQDRTQFYFMHSTPGDLESPIKWAIALRITAQQTDDSLVGWHINSIEITQYDSDGGITDRWTLDAPIVETSDGLWWVNHDDPESPIESEFTQPPVIKDDLIAIDPETPDLFVYLKGVPFEQGGDPPYNGHVAALTYQFALDSEPEPTGEGESEPVETGEEPGEGSAG